MSLQAAQQTRLRARVYGRVQGVNFRYHAVRAARQLGLSGWVANRWDGSVETVAEGGVHALGRFRAFLERGSPSSSVDRLEASWSEPATGEFADFRVRYL